MAIKTIGTNASNSLSGFVVGINDTIPADVAALITAIKGDPPGWQFWNTVDVNGVPTNVGTHRPNINQAYVQTGLLIIPNRGQIQLKPGDFVCWDATTGWPIVISGDAAKNGPYTHS